MADKYTYNSTYAFSENKVTNAVELEGKEAMAFQMAMWEMEESSTSFARNPNSAESTAWGAAFGTMGAIEGIAEGIDNLRAHPIQSLVGMFRMATASPVDAMVNTAMSMEQKYGDLPSGPSDAAMTADIITTTAFALAPAADFTTLPKLSIGLQEAGSGGTAFRYITEGELNAIQKTDLLRGGRPGETFFTKDLYKSAAKAQNRLALPEKPTLRIEFDILNKPNILRNGTKVLPANGMSGQGAEFMTTDPVQIKLINWQKLNY